MTDLKRLADVAEHVSCNELNKNTADAMGELATLLRSAAAETVGTLLVEIGYAEACNNRNVYACRLALAAARKERAALQRAIDEAIIFVEGHLTDENRRKLLAATLRPHATPSQPERVVTVTEPTTEAVRKMTYTSQPERAKDQPASRPCDCRELVARLALVVRDQIAGYINHDAVPDLDAIILDARGGS